MDPGKNIESTFNPASSAEAMFVGKIIKNEKIRTEIEALNDDDVIKDILILNFGKHPRFKNIPLNNIITELKKADIIKPLVVVEKKKISKVPGHIGIPNLEGLMVVEDKELTKTAVINIKKEFDAWKIENQKEFILENEDDINYLSKKSKEIQEVDFNPEKYIEAGLYSQEEMDKHNQIVKELEVIFEQKNTTEEKIAKKLAKIFEAIMIKGVDLSKCLGEDVIIRPAYPIDDFTGPKIDFYAILGDVPLGLDVSMRSIEGEAFVEKIEKILRTIQKGNPDGIKCYKNRKGKLEKDIHAPKVVVSCELSMIKELMFYLKNLTDEKLSEKLKNHRMSYGVVSQIVGCCQVFSKYADEIGEHEEAKSYKNIIKTLKEISEKSEILKRLLVGAGSDVFSKRVQTIVNKFKEKNINKAA